MNRKTTPRGEKLDQRKKDHIKLALDSQILAGAADVRFYYEPLLNAHPVDKTIPPFSLASKSMNYPLWVSSMTGGTASAKVINVRLAKACKEFGLGMGLGSCRTLLQEDTFFKDFHIRPYLGHDLPLFANLGVAQLEQIALKENWDKVKKMLSRLEADGLIIHVNPLQEWLQPEGDHISQPPIKTIESVLKNLSVPIIVKEVGQGMGPKSIEALLKLPLEAIEFAALGGTNFSKLEIKRSKNQTSGDFDGLSHIGHTAIEMVDMVNVIGSRLKSEVKCKSFIISGGIKNFLDGYYLIKRIKYPAIYGQASSMLEPARQGYAPLVDYIQRQINGLRVAYNYLEIR